jgi:putative ABC transport system ATP-binding protein
MTRSVIRLEDVKKTYMLGKTPISALRGVNFDVHKGDFIAILGPSGSGKTTLLSIMGLLDRPTEGHVYIEERDVSRLRDNELADVRSKKIGFIFQTFQLVPWLTALQNVEVPMIISNTPPGIRREKAIDALKRVGLGHRLSHKPLELSGGEMQRTAIARALVNDPDVVLADEPTGNLDSKTGQELIALLKELNEKYGTTLVIVTHNIELTKGARRVVHLRDGLIMEDGGIPSG